MPPWSLAPALEQLRAELNARWPNRDHHSDGAIGDTAHAATASDHNPNPQGVVCAYDIDTDLDGTDDSNDPEMDALVEWLRTHPHPDLKYVIYRGRMFSSYAAHGFDPFTWRPYSGDAHVSHPHVSVGQGPDGHSAPGTYDDTSPWLVGFGAQPLSSAVHPASSSFTEVDMTPGQCRDQQGRKWHFYVDDDGKCSSLLEGRPNGRLLEQDPGWTSGFDAECDADGTVAVCGRNAKGELAQIVFVPGSTNKPLYNVLGGHIFPAA